MKNALAGSDDLDSELRAANENGSVAAAAKIVEAGSAIGLTGAEADRRKLVPAT